MSNIEAFKLTVTNEGPVRISPQARYDLTWLAQSELESMPNKFSKLKKANQYNYAVTDNLWKEFPTNFGAELTFVDNRKNHETSYPEVQKLFQQGKISKQDPAMVAWGNFEDLTANVEVKVFTRPHYNNQSFQQQKWDKDETIQSVSSIKHEFSHGLQGILTDVIKKSNVELQNTWSHLWVAPDFLLEGYALTQETPMHIFLKDRRSILQPLLFQALKLKEHNISKPIINEEIMVNQYLNSNQLASLDNNFSDMSQIWSNYILNHLVYLAIIGVRTGLEARQLVDFVKSSDTIEFSMDEVQDLSIKEAKKLLNTIELPLFFKEEADRIELESQLYYYQNYNELAKAGEQVYLQYKKGESNIDPAIKSMNRDLLKKIIGGRSIKSFTYYVNQLIEEMWEWGNSSQYAQEKIESIKILNHALSVHSPATENPYYPILQRNFYLDGISDDTSYVHK